MEFKLPLLSKRYPVCYEVRLAITPERASEFDAWLIGHVREMLAFPGFQDARVYRDPRLDPDGREQRVVSYEIRSRRELDSYLHVHASRMRKEGTQRFGKDLSASRDIVPLEDYRPDPELQLMLDEQEISGGLPICGNCHQPVEGRFCRHCGQEDRSYLFSLGELLGEFLGELTNFDSRFFRSIKHLLLHPGFLTNEYIRGRRQNYFPPIRMYIIISLLFFFVAAVMTDSGLADADFDMLQGPNGEISAEDRDKAIAQLEEQLAVAEGAERQALQVALDSLRGNRVGNGTDAPDANGPGEDVTDATDEDKGGTTYRVYDAEPADGWQFPNIRIDNGVASASGWGSEGINRRMERGAEAIKENPRAFVRTMIDNIPSMMIIFLPLIAIALKFLYLFSSRYYVEHLMFTLHIHSAVFLILLAWLLVGELADLVKPVESVMGWITAATWVYVIVYLYRSLRRVYGQGHFMTSLKLFLLSICYAVAIGVTSAFLLVASIYQQA